MTFSKVLQILAFLLLLGIIVLIAVIFFSQVLLALAIDVTTAEWGPAVAGLHSQEAEL